jgi:hypothetical protein
MLALQEVLGLQRFVLPTYHGDDHLTITYLSPCVHTPHTPCDDQQGLILALAARTLSIIPSGKEPCGDETNPGCGL